MRILLLIALLFPCFSSTRADENPNGPWRYSLENSSPDWFSKGFDDSSWKSGPGGFGEPSTPGSRVNTEWTSPDIWLRRTVRVASIPSKPALFLHHDEDTEVYLNGLKVAELKRWTTEYQVVPLSDEAAKAIVEGENLLAVHCHQTSGGQFIDVHLIDADNVPTLPVPRGPDVPFQTKLVTEWGEKVTPENAWTEYPRPQFERSNWSCLNGLWDYTITDNTVREIPTTWTGKILVPFCLESRLSGVQRNLHPDQALWYNRTFDAMPTSGFKTILNFEAVDYRCEVFVNGHSIGTHIGGNLPFSLDASGAVRNGANELVVRVEDSTDGAQLRGKQHLRPHGIWYTRVSGIWQTVWIEQVPTASIEDLSFETRSLSGEMTIRASLSKSGDYLLRCIVQDGPTATATIQGSQDVNAKPSASIELNVQNPKLWSPDSPYLYQVKVELLSREGKLLDSVRSYFGIRKVARQKDESGHWRLTLNSKTIFHLGPLDQGWWPDGLLTPPSDQALLSDIEFLKSAGFNMIRKHIKVEPRRFYYHCDRLGMMVWQDQPSCLINPPWTRMAPNPVDAVWSDADHAQYMTELDGMVSHLEDAPCIVMWVPFNEAWGQHRTVEVGKWLVKRDPSRLVNVASGGNFWPVGDVADEHSYPHPNFPLQDARFKDYVQVVGEFGGHGWPVPDHLWAISDRNWGYGDLPKSLDELQARYKESMTRLDSLRHQGIAAGVYTQTTDVEGEINGLMTYDRRVIKIPAEVLRQIHAPLTEQ